MRRAEPSEQADGGWNSAVTGKRKTVYLLTRSTTIDVDDRGASFSSVSRTQRGEL